MSHNYEIDTIRQPIRKLEMNDVVIRKWEPGCGHSTMKTPRNEEVQRKGGTYHEAMLESHVSIMVYVFCNVKKIAKKR